MQLVFSVVALTLGLFLIAVLGIIAYLEYSTGNPEAGRLYFADILTKTRSGGVTPLLGSLTTFSYSLLLLSAFCSAMLAYVRKRSGPGVGVTFFWSMTAMLLALAGLDERFVFHENIGPRLGIDDAAIVAGYPLLLIIVCWWGRSELRRFRGNFWLAIPIVLSTGFFLYVDRFFPRAQSYRLLLEDGFKIVAVAWLFLLFFKCLLDELDRLVGTQHDAG